MVLECSKEIEVSSYAELFEIYQSGDIARAYSQTIPEGKIFDTSDRSEYDKIKNLLEGDEYNIYLISNFNGKFIISMIDVNVSVTINTDLKKGTLLYVRYGEDLKDTEIKENNEDDFISDSFSYDLQVY